MLFWAVCFIILLLAYLLVLAPQEENRRLTVSTLEETKLLAQSAKEAAQEGNKKLLIDKLSDSEKTLKYFVIEREKAANMTFEIDRIRDKREVILDTFSSDFTGSEGTKKTDNYKHITARQISVNFKSTFNMFANFLNALELNEPVVFIDAFSITRSTESDSGHSVSMNLAFLVEKDAKTKDVDG